MAPLQVSRQDSDADRATVASPAESIYDDDDEEPGLEGRGAATKRKFDDAIIQQRMEEDRERVGLQLDCSPLQVLTLNASINASGKISGRSDIPNAKARTRSLRGPGTSRVI